MRWVLGLATALLLAAAPAFAQYEVVQGFDDLPPKGPGSALGIVIWNHGVQNNDDLGKYPPPPYVRKLHAAGWDVIRIKRDPLFQGSRDQLTNWVTSGQRHIARTVEEVERVKAQGYKRVVLAGQSVGGAITVETARRVEVYAIVPSAPATGTATVDLGTSTAGNNGTAALYTALGDGKFERAVGIFPFADDYSSGAPDRGKRAREIMAGRGIPYLPLDDMSTILVGHTASGAPAMAGVYGDCLVKFLDPAIAPKGIARCGAEGLPESTDLLADIATLKPAPMATGEWWKQYEGIWVGAWNDPALIALALEKSATGYDLVYLYGARNGATVLPTIASTRRAAATLDGQSVAVDFPTQKVRLELDRTTKQVWLRWSNAQGRSGEQLLRAYTPREPAS